jgi:hypothetical protein
MQIIVMICVVFCFYSTFHWEPLCPKLHHGFPNFENLLTLRASTPVSVNPLFKQVYIAFFSTPMPLLGFYLIFKILAKGL